MAVLAESGKPASMLTRRFDPVPQLLRNLRYAPGVDLLAEAKVMAAIDAGRDMLAGRGRLLIRKSGTEPLVRVMAECEDEGLMVQVVDGIIAEMESVAA